MYIAPITNYSFTANPIRILAKDNNIGEELNYCIMKLTRTEKFGAIFENDVVEIPEPTQKIIEKLNAMNIKYEPITKKS